MVFFVFMVTIGVGVLSASGSPMLEFASPTLQNESVTSKNFIYINVTSNETLDTCWLDMFGLNTSMAVGGEYCYLNLSAWEYPSDGSMVAWFHFNKIKGISGNNIYINDSSGNSNDAIGKTYGYTPDIVYEGKFGNSSYWDDYEYWYLLNTSSMYLTNNLTIAAWVYPIWKEGNDLTIVNRFQSADNQRAYSFWIDGDNSTAFAWDHDGLAGGGEIITGNVNSIEFNKWQHVAVTLNDTHAVLYVNGKVDKIQAVTNSTIFNSAANIYIGQALNGGNNWFNGFMDEIAFYNRTLTASEIERLYKLGEGSYYFRVYANDTADHWNVTEDRKIILSTETFRITPVSPLNQTYTNRIEFTVNTNRACDWCRFSLNQTPNMTMEQVNSTWFNYTYSNLNSGHHSVIFYCMDRAGEIGTTEEIYFTVGQPIAIAYSVTPQTVPNGSNVSITANVSGIHDIDSIWAEITDPNDSVKIIMLQNATQKNYTTTVAGRYNITFFANDTEGNTESNTTYFIAEGIIQFSISVVNASGNGINSSVVIYYAGTNDVVNSYISSSGSFPGKNIVKGVYDILFIAFNGTFHVLLQNVNISANHDRVMGFDKKEDLQAEYPLVYAVNNTYSFSSARVKMYYNESVLDENNITLFLCTNWNFSGRYCNAGAWQSTNPIHNVVGNYFEIGVSDFSGFGIKETGTVCTDGDSRTCGVSDVFPCQYGIQVCINGQWGECIGSVDPSVEICNGLDDDCDGVVDNIGSGNSVQTTRCQCYNMGSPENETCDNIDNDCDGLVDEGITRSCGTDVGECVSGISYCSNGMWGNCTGGVSPVMEICNDGLDNDCDGFTDENCTGENVSSCTEGEIVAECICGDIIADSGYCCSGYYSNVPCSAEFPWLWLVAAGIIILAALAVLFLKFRKEGKELNWEELQKKYGPGTEQACFPMHGFL